MFSNVSRFFLILMCCVLSGCATLSGYNAKDLTNLNQLSVGMTKPEVAKVMGDTVIVGYEMGDMNGYQPVTSLNPQRVRTYAQGERTFEVSYYLTHIRQADGAVTDDELTPLIFENDRLIGKGWYSLNKIMKK